MQPDASPTTNRFARFVSGRTSKWLILGFWVVVLALAFSPAEQADRRAGERRASPGCPATPSPRSCSTRWTRFQSSDEIAGRVVYERPGGATTRTSPPSPARSAVRRRRPRRPRRRSARCRRGPAGPAGHRPDRRRQRRLDSARHHGRRDARRSPSRPPTGLSVHITGPVGFAADSLDGVRRASTASCCSPRSPSSSDPAVHLPQPGAVDPAGVLRGGVAVRRAGRDLPARVPRRPDRQRAERRASSPCWSSARGRTTPCCWSRATGRSCAATRTGTRRWRSRCTGPARRSSPAARR